GGGGGCVGGGVGRGGPGGGWAWVRGVPAPATEPGLKLTEVDAAFARAEEASGAGSVAIRRDELTVLFSRATASEQRFLVMLVGGELRQGALAGIMADAVARAAGVDAAAVRRAAMLAGGLPAGAAEGPGSRAPRPGGGQPRGGAPGAAGAGPTGAPP